MLLFFCLDAQIGIVLKYYRINSSFSFIPFADICKKNFRTMKRISFSIVLFAMLQLPLYAASSVLNANVGNAAVLPVGEHANMPRMRAAAMDRPDFKLLCSLLKEESFDKDCVKMIRIACIGNYFTSRQCADMLSILSFDSNRLEALEYIAPRVIDKHACDVILKEFSFISNREKAEDLLRGHKHR